MNTQDIQSRINVMPAALSAKGKVMPEVTYYIRANAEPSFSMSWRTSSAQFDYDRTYKSCDTADEADRFIADLPSIEEAKLAEFTEQLASIIELGRSHGIDVQFVNPLVEAMKRLSENAIPHYPKPKDEPLDEPANT